MYTHSIYGVSIVSKFTSPRVSNLQTFKAIAIKWEGVYTILKPAVSLDHLFGEMSMRRIKIMRHIPLNEYQITGFFYQLSEEEEIFQPKHILPYYNLNILDDIQKIEELITNMTFEVEYPLLKSAMAQMKGRYQYD